MKICETLLICCETTSEWQAKCFAGEFMVAKYLTQGMTPDEIAKSCGVSFEAADVQSSDAN